MSQKMKFQLNEAGVRELLKSPEMMAVCQEYAQNALSRLGDGYEMTTYTGKNRVNASIKAESPRAKRENSHNNTILKSLRG